MAYMLTRICIIRFESEVKHNHFWKEIYTTCKKPLQQNQNIPLHFRVNHGVTVSGWGSMTKLGKVSAKLQHSGLIVEHQTLCNKSYDTINSANPLSLEIEMAIPDLFQPDLLCAGSAEVSKYTYKYNKYAIKFETFFYSSSGQVPVQVIAEVLYFSKINQQLHFVMYK